MNDLVSITCPSCGAKIDVIPGKKIQECKYCGIEHIVQGEIGSAILESYASCPRCGKNDRVEKVSTIVSSQTQQVTGQEQKTEYFMNQGQRFSRTGRASVSQVQTTNLARSLKPPPRPTLIPLPEKVQAGNSILYGILCMVFAVLVGAPCSIISFLGQFDVSTESSDLFSRIMAIVVMCGMPTLIIFIIGAFVLYRGYKKKMTADERYEKELDHVKTENETTMNRWEKIMKRWESLYYCYRDDCIFIPQENTCASAQKMQEFLFDSI
ncbi:MAG: hypothetical protein JXA42_14845 [Anaerolineales bacterium]|nr:hypothetical protein [Anaerolineales bacterium]